MSSPTLSPLGHELMDDPDADPALVTLSLHNLARSNRWFGGWAAVRYGLARLLSPRPSALPATLTLLDLGTGLGDLPLNARNWSVARGLSLQPWGLDRSRVAAHLATRRGVPTVVACLGATPFAQRSVDIVLVSQVAHHLAPASVVALLRQATNLARVGVILTDLRRSRFAAAAFSAGSRLLRFDHATRHDGVLSLQRGYHPGELMTLLRQAGITASVARRPGYRLVATWRTG